MQAGRVSLSLKYPRIIDWLRYKKRLIAQDYDDVNLVTGREGRGKSKAARKIARRLDPTFGLHRIHFSWEPYQAQLETLERGQCIILDEFRGHRRESMTKDRMSVLDEFKENRGLGIHHFLVFNRFTKLDRDLVNDRVSDWTYIRKRGVMEIRQPTTELVFDWDGEPSEPTKYPLVGLFPFTDTEPQGVAAGYKAMKDARMRDRRARNRGEDQEPAKPGPEVKGPPAWLLDEILKETKR